MSRNPYAARAAEDRPIGSGLSAASLAFQPGDDPPEGDFRVSYQNSAEDIAILLRRVERASRMSRAWAWCLPLLALSVGGFFLRQVPFGLGWIVPAGATLASAIGFRALLVLATRGAIHDLAKQFHEQPPEILTLTPEAVVSRDGTEGSGRTPWGKIMSVVVEDQAILLDLTGPRSDSPMAYIVPRRAFPTPEAYRDFARASLYWKGLASPTPSDHPGPSGPAATGPSVSFVVNEEERRVHRRASRIVYRHLVPRALGAASGAMLWGALALVAVIAAVRQGQPEFSLMALCAFLVVMGGWLGVVTLQLGRLILLGPRREKTPAAAVRWTITAAGLAVHSADGSEGSMPWTGCVGIGKESRFLKILVRPHHQKQRAGGVILIPLRAFATHEEADAFWGELSRRYATASASDEAPGVPY